MKALIDSDIARYQFGSVEMKHPFLDGIFVPASSDYICKLVDGCIQEVIDATGADSYVCALSGKGNFRHQVSTYQPYKGNRNPNLTRPYHYETIERHIIDNHPHVVVDGMEADDWLGIEQRKDPQNTCIASRDKDLWTVLGYHFRFACGERQPAIPMKWVSEEEANAFFFHQMLIGDTTDNILGCGKKILTKWGKNQIQCYNGNVIEVPSWGLRRKGIGEKASMKLLAGLETPQQRYDVVSAEYKTVFGDEWEDAMLEMARLLYIGQEPDKLFDWDWLKVCK